MWFEIDNKRLVHAVQKVKNGKGEDFHKFEECVKWERCGEFWQKVGMTHEERSHECGRPEGDGAVERLGDLLSLKRW